MKRRILRADEMLIGPSQEPSCGFCGLRAREDQLLVGSLSYLVSSFRYLMRAQAAKSAGLGNSTVGTVCLPFSFTGALGDTLAGVVSSRRPGDAIPQGRLVPGVRR